MDFGSGGAPVRTDGATVEDIMSHRISTDDFAGYPPDTLLASGEASDGQRKRLWLKVNVISHTMEFAITQSKRPERRFPVLSLAVAAYNSL